jgi:type III restriction enzyme
MSNPFFERPIVNSPYEDPRQHWELDSDGQPTGNLIDRRRRADFITSIPKAKKQKAGAKAAELNLDQGPSTAKQKVRPHVDHQRSAPASG